MSGATDGALWAALADLPLEIEDYSLERLERDVSSSFTRVSTVLRLRGDGHEGLGEDVSYDAEDQLALQDAGPVQPLAGSWTLEAFCDHLATLDLCQEGRGLVEFCAGELDAVGKGLEELRLDELVARLEQRPA